VIKTVPFFTFLKYSFTSINMSLPVFCHF
jgi:hypothetical protein